MTRLKAPTQAPIVQLKDVDGKIIDFRNGKRTLLVFYRDPACPFCNYNIFLLTNKFAGLSRLDLQIIAVFSADIDAVKRFTAARPRPFPVAAEPSYKAYEIYGIEKSFTRKLLAVITRFVPWLHGMAEVGFIRSAKALGGINTSNNMPADFLIDEKGRIVEAYYGKDAGDHIPFERVHYFAYKGFEKRSAKRRKKMYSKIPII